MILLRKVKQLCFFFYSSIDDDLNVKVTDCALSRDLFPQDYCCLGDNENRPVKWMAVESLEKLRFTVASDVVSFSYNLLQFRKLKAQENVVLLYGAILEFQSVPIFDHGD